MEEIKDAEIVEPKVVDGVLDEEAETPEVAEDDIESSEPEAEPIPV